MTALISCCINNIMRIYLIICATQVASGVLIKMVKHFEVNVKHFKTIPRVRNCGTLISHINKFFINHPIIFLNQENKMTLVLTSFSCFL